MKPWFLKLKKAAQDSISTTDSAITDWHSADNLACSTEYDPTGSSLKDAIFIQEASPARVLALILELESAYAAQTSVFVPEADDT